MSDPRLQQHFIDAADLLYQAVDGLGPALEAAVAALVAGLTGGGKVLVAADAWCWPLAAHAAALLVGGFERARPELGALALPAAPSPASQVRALGQPGDVLLLLTAAPGVGEDLVAAVRAAQEREMTVVWLGGGAAGADEAAALLRETDVALRVPHERRARVFETHALALHALCDGVDIQLLGEQETP